MRQQQRLMAKTPTPRRARWLLAAALLPSLTLSSGTARAADAGQQTSKLSPPVPGTMQRWSAAHMTECTPEPTRDCGMNIAVPSVDVAISIARRFNLIVVADGQFNAYETEMHAANPLLKTLVYLNGTYSKPSETYPESWYARDVNGNKIRSKLFGNYLMEVANPAWGDDRAQVCSRLLASSHADGCYADMLGVSSINPDYCTGLAINPGTGQVWTWADYVVATSAIANKMRAASPERPLAGNGLGNGTRFYGGYRSSRDILKVLDAGHSEIWLRDGRTPLTGFPDEASWKKNVDMLADAASVGEGVVLAQTKVWIPATQQQLNQWHKYALASFLLGNDGRSWFTFSKAKTLAAATVDHPWDRVDVGIAAGPYEHVGRAYQREFTKGFAAVNPTNAPVTVTMPAGVYKNLAGRILASETLPPHSGDVFTLGP